MKFLLGLSLAALLACSACKKDEEPTGPEEGQFFIEARIDGELFRIEQALMSPLTGQWNNRTDSIYVTAVAGFMNVNQADRNYLSINVILEGDSARLNTPYTTVPSGIAGEVPSLLSSMVYFDALGNSYVCHAISDQLGFETKAEMVFTEVSSSIMKGTFSGIYYLNSTESPKVITEGRFYCKRYQ